MLSNGYRFRPGLVPTIAVLLLVPVLTSLGFWQLDRAAQKRAIQVEYDARSQEPALAIGVQARAAEELRFHRVVAKGSYDPAYQILIDNRIHRGQAGYHVITPLRIGDGKMRVLVNRGWVPLGATRAELPPAPAPQGTLEVRGIATVPREIAFMLGEPEPLSGSWRRVWQHLDMPRYAQAVPFPVQPVVILLDPESAAGGFTRDWDRLNAGIAVHQGYAFQWFTLAAAVLVLYVVLNLSRARGSGGRIADAPRER